MIWLLLEIKVEIQNMVMVATSKNFSNAEIAFHIMVKTWFGQLNPAFSLRIGHILNPRSLVISPVQF